MKASFRLFGIALLAPALAHLTGAVVLFAPMLLFTAPLSYPLSVLVAGVAVPSLHAFLVCHPRRAAQQLVLAAPVGAGLGLVAYGALSWAVTPSAMMAAGYAAFGALNSVLCWLLYNWGPFNVSGSAHSVHAATRQ